jgi:hypothetical protein
LQITSVICGYRVEEIVNPLTQKVRYLDKLADELAKGKRWKKICEIHRTLTPKYYKHFLFSGLKKIQKNNQNLYCFIRVNKI